VLCIGKERHQASGSGKLVVVVEEGRRRKGSGQEEQEGEEGGAEKERIDGNAQEWNNRTFVGHEPLICNTMCFTKTELFQ